TQTSNTLHNAIMEAGGKDRPPMLAPDKEVPVTEGSSVTTTKRYMENYKNVSQDIRDKLNVEAEAVQIILTAIDNDIYSTVDACPNHHNEVNELRAGRLARTANPLALVSQQQPVYHPQNHPTHYTLNSSTRSQQAATRNREKAIVNSPPPINDQEPSMVAEDDEMPDEWTILNGLKNHSSMLSIHHVDDCQHPKELLCQQESSLRNLYVKTLLIDRMVIERKQVNVSRDFTSQRNKPYNFENFSRSVSTKLVFLTLSCEHDVVIFDFRLELVSLSLAYQHAHTFLEIESFNKTSFLKFFNFYTLSLQEGHAIPPVLAGSWEQTSKPTHLITPKKSIGVSMSSSNDVGGFSARAMSLIQTVPVAEGSSETTTEGYMENYKNVSQDIQEQLNVEAKAIQIILTRIDNDIYSTIDDCPNACEIWKAIERLKQGVEIVNSPPLNYDPDAEMVAEDDALSNEKEIDKPMALISLSFKKIYKTYQELPKNFIKHP
nr:hypothetical protein [Tanacetum cinerariifolium]